MFWDSHPLVICFTLCELESDHLTKTGGHHRTHYSWAMFEHAEKNDRKLTRHSPSSLKSTAVMARYIPDISTYKLWL